MDKQKIIKLILMLVFLVVVIIVAINLEKELTANAIKEQEVQEEWFVDNCECIERERLKCREGFELVGRICKSEGAWTNVLLGCSKYNCSEEIHEFNLEKEKWEKNQN